VEILGHSENDRLFPVEAVRAGDMRTSDGVSANTKTLQYLLSRRFLE